MKLQILHDKSGAICAVFAPVETKRRGGIYVATPQQSVMEAQVSEVAVHGDGTETDIVNATILHVLEKIAKSVTGAWSSGRKDRRASSSSNRWPRRP